MATLTITPVAKCHDPLREYQDCRLRFLVIRSMLPTNGPVFGVSGFEYVNPCGYGFSPKLSEPGCSHVAHIRSQGQRGILKGTLK